MSKLFEYKATRKDSQKSFKCISTVDVPNNTSISNAARQLTISKEFRVEYAPLGLGQFGEAQRSGRQIAITAVQGEDITITIEFEAEPSPTKGSFAHL